MVILKPTKTNYGEDGYTIQRFGERLDRFPELVEADFAELLAQGSYLMYRYGGKLDQLMEQRYQNQNKKVREEEDRKAREALEAIKKRFASGEVSVEEYTKLLEERNTILEKERDRVNLVEAEIGQVKQDLYLAAETNQALQNTIDELKREIVEKEELFKETEERYKSEIESQRLAFEQEILGLQSKLEESEALYLATMAQLHGLRYQHGLIGKDEDYSSKEMLLVLEREKNAFDKFFAAQWKQAKKQIRSNVFKKTARNASESSDTTDINGEKGD